MEFMHIFVGIRVLVHDQNTMPFPEDEGIAVAVGMSTSIGIQMVGVAWFSPKIPYMLSS